MHLIGPGGGGAIERIIDTFKNASRLFVGLLLLLVVILPRPGVRKWLGILMRIKLSRRNYFRQRPGPIYIVSSYSESH